MSQVLLASYGTPAFDPSSISGLQVWLKANALSLNDNDPVSSWTDFSGTSNHAVQSNGSKKPVYKTGIANGKAVVRFDGSNDILEFTTELSHPASIFIVAATASTPGNGDLFIGDSGSAGGGIILWASSNNSSNWGTIDTNFTIINSGENLVTGVFNLLELTTTVGALFIYRNGVQKGTSNAQSYGGPGPNSSLGAQDNGSGFVDCDIAEVLVYNTVLSGTDRGHVEGYLMGKYNL